MKEFNDVDEVAAAQGTCMFDFEEAVKELGFKSDLDLLVKLATEYSLEHCAVCGCSMKWVESMTASCFAGIELKILMTNPVSNFWPG